MDCTVSGAAGLDAFVHRNRLRRASKELADTYGLPCKSRDFTVEIGVFHTRNPCRRIVFRCGPVAFAACVISLAIVDVSVNDGAGSGAGPIRTGHHVFHPPVFIFYAQFGDEAERRSAIYSVGDGAAPPSVAHLRTDYVGAFAYE